MEFPYKRVLIAGCSGAGKSFLARAMGERFDLPVVHLDRIWWLPGWAHITREEFDEKLAAELKKPSWIIDGDYARTFATRLKRADFCVYLDVDTQTCLQGARERVRQYRGRTRPDMTEGCDEYEDEEFERFILAHWDEVRPKLLRELDESGVEHRIFTTREEAYAWLDGFNRAKR